MSWLVSIAFLILIKSINAQSCDNGTYTPIYAADNMSNGTIRLYSNFSYYDLLLYWDKSNSGFVFHQWNDSRLNAVVESTGDVRHIYDKWNRSVSVLDSKTYHSAIVSLNDQLNQEYTIFFMSQLPQAHATHPTGHYFFWNTSYPEISHISPFGSSTHNQQQDKSDFKIFALTAAFRVYINDEQHLFMIVNNTLYQGKFVLKNFKNKNLSEDIDVTQTQHLGSIPTVTAAFAVQPNLQELWVCLINCDKYCLVPSVFFMNKTVFNFSQCVDHETWSKLPSMKAITNLNSEFNLMRLVNYPSKQRDDWCELSQIGGIITRRHVAYAILFSLLLFYSLLLIAILRRSCSGQKYDIGKAEYRNILHKASLEGNQTESEPIEVGEEAIDLNLVDQQPQGKSA